jgi:hypothetical protein
LKPKAATKKKGVSTSNRFNELEVDDENDDDAMLDAVFIRQV